MTLAFFKSVCELPEYRFVLGNLIARDLKVRYRDMALGFLWSMLHPALLLGIWYLVFSQVARLDIGGPRYWAFLVPGLLVYQFVHSAILEGARSVRDNAGIVRKVYVPVEILVIAAVTVKLVEFAIQIVVAIALLALLHRGGGVEFSLGQTLAALPGAMVLIYLFALGAAMPLAGFTVLYRDLDYLLNLALTALMYLSPIFWSLSMIADRGWMPLFALNPLADLVILLRDPMYWGRAPENLAVGGGAGTAWAVAVAASLAWLLAGYALLSRVKHTLAEVV